MLIFLQHAETIDIGTCDQANSKFYLENGTNLRLYQVFLYKLKRAALY